MLPSSFQPWQLGVAEIAERYPLAAPAAGLSCDHEALLVVLDGAEELAKVRVGHA
jgi:hypothetical protein